MKYFDRINAYFEGELSSSEEAKLWEEIEQNSELKKEFDNYMLSMEVFNRLGEPTKEKIQFLLENKKRITKTNRLKRYALRIAAVFIPLILIFFFLNNTYKKSSIISQIDNTELRVVEKTKNFNNQNKGNTAVSNSIMETFKDRKFNQCIDILSNFEKSIQEGEKEYLMVQKNQIYFIGAYVYYHLNSFEESNDYFYKVISDSNVNYKKDKFLKEAAEFFIIRNFLVMNANSTAINNKLDNIINNQDHEFIGEAKNLKKRINSFWFQLFN